MPQRSAAEVVDLLVPIVTVMDDGEVPAVADDVSSAYTLVCDLILLSSHAQYRIAVHDVARWLGNPDVTRIAARDRDRSQGVRKPTVEDFAAARAEERAVVEMLRSIIDGTPIEWAVEYRRSQL